MSISFATQQRRIRLLLQDQSGRPLCGPREMELQIRDSFTAIAQRVQLPDTVQGTPVTLTSASSYTLSGSYIDRIRRITDRTTGLDLDPLDEATYRDRHRGNPAPLGIPNAWALVDSMDEDETDPSWKLLVTPAPSTDAVGRLLDVYYTLLPSIFTASSAIPLDDGLTLVLRYHVALAIANGWTEEQRAERRITEKKLTDWAAAIEQGLTDGWIRRNQGKFPSRVVDVY